MNKKLTHNVAFGIVISFFIADALLSAFVRADEGAPTTLAKEPARSGPWGFNLSLYVWLPGVSGDFTAGRFSGSVDANFIDIVDKSRRFPLGFNGHFEAHYDRFAFYLDGNYMNIKLKPRFGRISEGVNSELGIMDYGLMYRILGAKASEIQNYREKKRPFMLDAYAGARTLWFGSSAAILGPSGTIQRSPSVSASFTSPIIGGRVGYEFTPHWFVLVDGNIGGFGAQDVKLTDGILGLVGYRTTFYDIPASIEAGYKAVHYEVDKSGPAQTNATLNGPFLGLTGYW